MEIHFYESEAVLPEGESVIYDWKGMKNIWDCMHNNGGDLSMTSIIHTTQMCMLSSTWLIKGHRMFVHQDNGVVYEITLKSKDNYGDRAVRVGQNVYAMWAGNMFRE